MSESERPQHICRLPTHLTATLVCFQVILCSMSIAQIVIGALCQYACPQQPYISIYLLVMGVLSLLLAFLTIMHCTGGFGNHSTTWICLVSFFFFCFFTAGITWIYSIDVPNFNKTMNSKDTFCNKTLYQFALWSTNLSYLVLLYILLCSCCTCLLFGEDESTTQENLRVVVD
ncbi:transmembrane protein 272-like [Amphiprion ocellaris]|nr:transmembrane protein 272-like [Amphiprion ocellaris]XP_054863498.1 transmembrane protein 272-like [Amphiprion ocellaris]